MQYIIYKSRTPAAAAIGVARLSGDIIVIVFFGRAGCVLRVLTRLIRSYNSDKRSKLRNDNHGTRRRPRRTDIFVRPFFPVRFAPSQVVSNDYIGRWLFRTKLTGIILSSNVSRPVRSVRFSDMFRRFASFFFFRKKPGKSSTRPVLLRVRGPHQRNIFNGV